MEQRDAEMRQVQKQVEVLLQESKTHLQALEEEKERTRIQVSTTLIQERTEANTAPYFTIKRNVCTYFWLTYFRLNNLWTSGS